MRLGTKLTPTVPHITGSSRRSREAFVVDTKGIPNVKYSARTLHEKERVIRFGEL